MTMIPRGASARLSLAATVAAAALVAFAPGRLHAAASDFALRFSDKAKDPAPKVLTLRPTVEQQLFVYVENKGDDEKEVTVEVLAGDAPVAASQPVTAKKGITQIDFAKQEAAPAAPAGVPPAPAPKPAAPPAPPAALEEAKGDLVVRIVDKDKQVLGKPVPLRVTPPSQYIDYSNDLDSTHFDPNPGRGKKNELAVTVTATERFVGKKPCKVEMVLDVPGLKKTPRKEGTRIGYITEPKASLTLTADNLQFNKGDGAARTGVVTLTIDGWQRAYTFEVSFPPEGKNPTAPERVTDPKVRIVDAALVANPAAPYPVKIEADDLAGGVVELGLDRNNDKEFKEENNEIEKFTGDRHERILFGAAGPGGSLLVAPQVEDWTRALDVTGIDGRRQMQVEVKRDEAAVQFRGTPPLPADAPPEPLGPLVDKLKFAVQFDESKPQSIQLAFPNKIKRGDDLPVQAWSEDDLDPVRHNDIHEVVFYLGKPGADGAPPATAVPVKGEWHEKEQRWAAVLPAPIVPPGVKAQVDVTAEFIKFTNVASNGTATVKLEDAAAPGPGPGVAAAPKPGSIVGLVYQGGTVMKVLKDPKDPNSGEVLKLVDPRPQPNITVRLVDDKGALKDTTKTRADGTYEFKPVPPGSYRVTASKASDSTSGEAAALVVEGPSTADVKLVR